MQQVMDCLGVLQGKVSWIESYGAFVDVGVEGGQTVSGMIHKTELSWGYVIVPDTVVSVGARSLFCPNTPHAGV